VLLAGISGDCGMLHVAGGAVEPATQVSATELPYPLMLEIVPLKAAAWLGKTVSGVLEMARL